MAETQRAIEEALITLRRAIHDNDDHLLHAIDVLTPDTDDAQDHLEEFDSRLAMLFSEIHQHELDHRDDGWWICWCGNHVRRVEREDFDDDDRDI
jgi:hypothetical protein